MRKWNFCSILYFVNNTNKPTGGYMTNLDRDYQRAKLYKAEIAAFPDIHNAGNVTPRTMEWVEGYAETIKSTEYWRSMGGWKRIQLRDGRGCRRASYRPRSRAVVLPAWARSEVVMIHEFAHALTHRVQRDFSGHGTYFCGHYLRLLEELMGGGAASRLLESFWAHGVRYKFSKPTTKGVQNAT